LLVSEGGTLLTDMNLRCTRQKGEVVKKIFQGGTSGGRRGVPGTTTGGEEGVAETKRNAKKRIYASSSNASLTGKKGKRKSWNNLLVLCLVPSSVGGIKKKMKRKEIGRQLRPSGCS